MCIRDRLLWKYIEGNCDEAERQLVEKAFANDKTLKHEWHERRLLHESMKEIELEIPSMRFTQNVMDMLPQRYAYSISKRGLINLLILVIGLGLITLIGLVFSKPPTPTGTVNSIWQDYFSSGESLNQLLFSDNLFFLGLIMTAFLLLYALDKFVLGARKAS